MKEYQRVRKMFEVLERQTTKGYQLKLESYIPEELEAIRNFKPFCKIQVSQLEVKLTNGRNVIGIYLSLVYEFHLPKANICGGTLFSDGTIILANNNHKEIGLFIIRLKMDTGETVRVFVSNYYFLT